MVISMAAELQHYADACRRCADMCIEATMHGVGLGADEAQLRPLMDCADLCNTCANFLRRMSRMSWRVGDICGEICEQCAAICERYPEDETMARCARACLDCADACQKMAKLVTKAA
jgi:hypothetical protein